MAVVQLNHAQDSVLVEDRDHEPCLDFARFCKALD